MIVVDDGSKDKISNLARTIQETISHLSPIQLPYL